MATLTMFDSIEVGAFPANPQAVAGYVGGHWPTYVPLVSKFPKAHHLSIAVNSQEHARCLDVEPGDATNAQAAGWFHNFADRARGKPVFYTSAGNAQALINSLDAAGIKRDQYWLWSAHYGREHICGRNTCGYPNADGTQWTSSALGRTLDQSVVNDYVFASPAKPREFPTGVAHFTGSFDTSKGAWTITGINGSFQAGTKGKTAAAYLTFDESKGHWTIRPRPWAKGLFARLFHKE